MAHLKRALAGLLAAAIAVGATACSSKPAAESGASASGGTPTTQNVSLRFSWWGGDDRAQKTMDVIKQYEKLHSNVTIEGESQSSDGYNDKLATELSANTAPDIMQVGTGYMPAYVSSSGNYFIDFNKYPAFKTSDFDADFLKANGNYDGHQYGIPTGVTGYSLIVNSDLCAKAGLDFTKQYTWDDLFTMSDKLKSYDKSAYLVDGNLFYIYSNMVRAYIRQLTGNSLLIDKDKKLGATEAQLTETYTLLKKMYDKGVLPPESHMASYEKDNMQKDPDWISGKYASAFTVASTMDVMAAANKNAKYIAGKMPTIANGASDGYFTDCPQYMCISAQSKNIDTAVDFLNYFYNNADAAKTLGATRSVPPTKTAQKICIDNKLVSDITQSAVDVSLSYKGKSDSGFTTSSEVESIIEDAISNIAYGKTTPQAEAAKTVNLLNNYLSNQK